MVAKNIDKFLLLMWKNWLLQYRHPLQTAVEILSPVLFVGLIVFMRTAADTKNHPQNTFYKEFQINNSLPKNIGNNQGFTVVYSPENGELQKIMENLKETMDLSLIGLKNAEEMSDLLKNSNLTKGILCGVQFEDSLANVLELPPNMRITLRFPAACRFSPFPVGWETFYLFPRYQISGPRQPKENDGGYPPGYNTERFLAVQQILSYSIINYFRRVPLNTNQDLPNITMQRYPYPTYIYDPLLVAMPEFFSMIITISFLYTCTNTVKAITAEKEKQLKEAMKIMGLPNWLHWLAWFLKSFSFLLISVISIVLLLKVKWVPESGVSIFTNSDVSVILVFLSIYMCTTITFCFMISVFFSKANAAATIAGVIWFFSSIPYLLLDGAPGRTTPFTTKLLVCLGINTAMSYGFQIIIMREGIGEGLQWWTIFKPISPDDNFVLGHVILMLIVDALIYLIIALYIEGVFPGEYGVPLPWNFPFTASYWSGKPKFISVEDIQTISSEAILNSEIYEAEPYNTAIGVQIKHLRKEFGKKKVAVRDLSLNLHKGQITVLLGHNGAGKTTTMSILTGMFPPTSGTALVDGHDIRSDMPGVRGSLGFCPQHNILFDDLTVKEHIYFYSKLKGLNKKEIDREIEKFIKNLELTPKAKALSKSLSGGMKRKLSVCVALCGNSKVVFLDEPTAGMDPTARRTLWDLLQKEKKNRTMLLSTHFMDEADLLGDRIAIMSGGTLQCCGSSFFLKKRYGAGYHLTMEKSVECNVMQVTEFLKDYVPEIQVQNNVGSELTYLLAEDQLPVFEEMLKDLEENSHNLGILNYGISLTTMEEVFLKVGADHGQEGKQNALGLQTYRKVDPNNIMDVVDRWLRQNTESKQKIIKVHPENEDFQVSAMTKSGFLN